MKEISELFFFIKATSPSFLPTIDGAPSVQIPANNGSQQKMDNLTLCLFMTVLNDSIKSHPLVVLSWKLE